MATFRRSLTPGGTYFFTGNTLRRQRRLTDPQIYAALKMAIRRVKKSHPFDIEAFVLLPDHLHCIWRLPAGDMNYAMRELDKAAGRPSGTRSFGGGRYGFTRETAGTRWQRRFWEHQIRGDDDFMRHVAYIHFNPVRHGYVQRVNDWPYFGFHAHVRQGLCSID